MLSLFNFFVDLCLLRKAPQDLPASPVLFALVLLANLMLGTLGILDVFAVDKAMLAVVTDALLMLVLLRMALLLKQHGERFMQTATAILGAGIVLTLLAFPLQIGLQENMAETAFGTIASLAYLMLILWIQLVIGHILRHALQVSLTLGIGLAFTYSVISSTLVQYLFLDV